MARIAATRSAEYGKAKATTGSPDEAARSSTLGRWSTARTRATVPASAGVVEDDPQRRPLASNARDGLGVRVDDAGAAARRPPRAGAGEPQPREGRRAPPLA